MFAQNNLEWRGMIHRLISIEKTFNRELNTIKQIARNYDNKVDIVYVLNTYLFKQDIDKIYPHLKD